MTPELNRIEIDLLPLQLLSRRISEGWATLPGHPLYMPADYPQRPDTHSEAHLMTICVTPQNATAPLGGRPLHARTSAFTLYVTGTLFGLSLYSLELLRLVEDFDEPYPSQHSSTIH